jgi:hypothetical protein
MLVAPPTAKPNDRRRSRRDRDVGFRPSGKLEQIAWLGREVSDRLMGILGGKRTGRLRLAKADTGHLPYAVSGR